MDSTKIKLAPTNASNPEAATLKHRRIKDWEFYSLEHAYRPREPIQYAIDGLFALPSLNIVYGWSGCLKSLLLADAAVCVASGQPWLPWPDQPDRQAFAVKQGPVVWIDLDNGERHSHERFGALGRMRNVPADAPLYYISIPVPYPRADRSRHIADLVEAVGVVGPHLIVIDNLGTISGGVEENSSGMIKVMANLRNLAEKTKAAVVVIHHRRKDSIKQAYTRQGDMLRGHSSIEASLDLALQVVRKRDTVTVKSTKERGPKVQPFGAEFVFEHAPGTQDLYTARFWAHEPEVDPKIRKIDRAIYELLRDGPFVGKTDFDNTLHGRLKGVGKDLISDRVKDLRDAGKLIVDHPIAGKRTESYSLAPGKWPESTEPVDTSE